MMSDAPTTSFGVHGEPQKARAYPEIPAVQMHFDGGVIVNIYPQDGELARIFCDAINDGIQKAKTARSLSKLAQLDAALIGEMEASNG